ncbi:unnamed protein product [Closterium sp. NIES-53]
MHVLTSSCSDERIQSVVHPLGHADASWADDQATQRSSQGYTFSLGSGSVSWRSIRSSSVLGSSCEAEIYAGAMAAQELRWLTYLLTDLGEQPRSPPVLYVGERLAYVASQANTADIFTKALAPGDHQRFCTMLACFALLDWSCDLLFSPTLPMGKEHAAFSALKNVLCSPPVLRIADPHRPFEVVADASDIAIGAVLLQDFGNGLQPIAYESPKLHPVKKNYPIHDREMLAIVHAFKAWRYYLTSADLTVRTDHRSL